MDSIGGTFALGFLVGLSAFTPPGPVVVYLIQQSLHRGFRAGLSVTLASALVGAGMLVLILETGIRMVFESPVFHLYIGLIGGISLITLGVLIGRDTLFSPLAYITNPPESSYSSSFVGGLAVNTGNPLVYIWWALIGIPSLGAAGELAGSSGLYSWSGGILGALFLWYGGISYLASQGVSHLPKKAIQVLSLLSGIFLVIFGLFLLVRYVLHP
ncbi:MAG: LysE family translocator [Methanomicrobiales archaeon]|nr:LysE family translocator [Methanomicrobiales archaeon]